VNEGVTAVKTVRIKVYGKVQGVGFRYYTLRQANKLGVKGWVRNVQDGTVEIVAQGDPASLDRLSAAVKQGSPASEVKRIHVEEIDGMNRYSSFQVKY
jgi:acylphosphatase